MDYYNYYFKNKKIQSLLGYITFRWTALLVNIELPFLSPTSHHMYFQTKSVLKNYWKMWPNSNRSNCLIPAKTKTDTLVCSAIVTSTSACVLNLIVSIMQLMRIMHLHSRIVVVV